MKSIIPLLFIIIGSIMLNIGLYRDNIDLRNAKPKQIPPTLIWNADNEALPADGKLVIIEKTINDTIYIGPIE